MSPRIESSLRTMGNDRSRDDAHYTRTPLVKRLPMVASLALALILAGVLGHALWSRLLIFVGTIIVCVLILRYLFGQPLERLLSYKEFSDS
jgi:Flp pilus assembly protein TadB